MSAATSMIEKASEFGASAQAPLSPEMTDLSAGAMLRHAREARGLHLDAVAAALKVPVKKIEALENDALDSLPDAVFARALAASMCRALQVDPAPVLAKLPGASRTGLADADKTINANFRGGSERTGRGAWRSSRGLVAVIALLLIGAVVLHFMPESLLGALRASLQNATQRGTAPEGLVTDATSVLPGSPASPAANTQTGSVIEPIVVQRPATPQLSAEVTTAAAMASLPVASASGVPAAGSQLVTFAVRSEAWITVTDSHNTVLLKRTVPAGEAVGVSGSLPLSVVVGRAQGVDVQVRGQPFDLKPLTGPGGVARFSVRP